MKITTKKVDLETLAAELLVVIVSEKDLKAPKRTAAGKDKITVADLDRLAEKNLLKLLKRVGFTGKSGRDYLTSLCTKRGLLPVLFVGAAGKAENQFELLMQYRKLGSLVFRQAKELNASRVCISGANLSLDDSLNFGALIEGFGLTDYSFDLYRPKNKTSFKGVRELTIAQNKKVSSKAAYQALTVCKAVCLARDMINTSPKDCTPSYLVRQARAIAKKGKLKIQVFDKNRLKKLGAGSLLSVAHGSDEPPYLIKLSYIPRSKNRKVISIVGKGVTFDSGGLSIKPADGMETMKSDMSGAAAVLCTMQAISVLKPNHEIRCYVPTTENMINGKATRPGDVVRASNGKTIEILNTDAEGRLILADALVMADRDGCDVIIDLATLTGACMVALGMDYAGLFATEIKLAENLIAAGDQAGEPLWLLPLPPEYRSLLKSSVADLKNIGGRYAGAITAALFLKEFVGKNVWAHIDIAGPSFRSSDAGHLKAGGVGFGVRTLVNYIQGL